MTEQEKIELQDRIQSVQERIARAAERAGRDPQDIILVAASKMNDACSNSGGDSRMRRKPGAGIVGKIRAERL